MKNAKTCSIFTELWQTNYKTSHIVSLLFDHRCCCCWWETSIYEFCLQSFRIATLTTIQQTHTLSQTYRMSAILMFSLLFCRSHWFVPFDNRRLDAKFSYMLSRNFATGWLAFDVATWNFFFIASVVLYSHTNTQKT